MDSTERTERLERARRAVAEGEAQIERQRALIAHLEKTREDASAAHALLDTLVKRQAERLENLGHVIREFPRRSGDIDPSGVH
jgi:hypothetical protein